MLVYSYGMGLFTLVWFGSTWIESESSWFQITEFLRPTFSTSKLFLCSAFSKTIPPRFSISQLAAPLHGDILWARYDLSMIEMKMSKIPCILLVIYGRGLPLVLDGFSPIFSSVLRPKSTLIPLPIFRLSKRKYQSLCPHLSIGDLACLECTMSSFSTFHYLLWDISTLYLSPTTRDVPS